MIAREVRVGTVMGQPAARIDIRCGHGASTLFVLPGHDPLSDKAAVELAAKMLGLRHGTRLGCECEPRADASSARQ